MRRRQYALSALGVLGVLVCLIAALMMYCQERCFLRVDLELWPAVLGIIGIGLIANFFLVFLINKLKTREMRNL